MEVLRKGAEVKAQLRKLIEEREDWTGYVKRVVREAQVEALGVAPANVAAISGAADFEVEYVLRVADAQKKKVEAVLSSARATLEQDYEAIQEAKAWLPLLHDDDLVEMELEDLQKFAVRR